ncbi:MAG: CHASE2 domain-containing protein [Pseudomonadales bacterium]
MNSDIQTVAFPARRYRIEVALLFSLLVLFAIAAARYEWLESLDHLYYDLLLRIAPAPLDERIVIVGIDEQTLGSRGRWPWPRDEQAQLITAVLKQQPAALLVDVVYSSATDPEQDARLVAALAASQNTAIAVPVIFDSVALDRPPVEILPAPELLGAVDVLGHVHVQLDRDSISRGTYLYQGVGNAHWPHLSLALARHLDWLAEPLAECQEPEPAFSLALQRCRFAFIPFAGPPGTIPQLSALALLDGAAPADTLTDKVVLLGLTAAGVADWVTSPVSGGGRPISGVEYNANLLNALTQGLLIEPAPAWLPRLLAGLFAALAAVLLPRLAPKPMLLVALLFGVVPLLVSAASLWFWQVYLPLAAASFAGLLAYPFWSWRRHEIAWRYLDQEMDRVAASKEVGLAYFSSSRLADDWRSMADQACTLLNLEAVVDTVPVVGTAVQPQANKRGVLLLLGPQGSVRLQRPAAAAALDEGELALINALFAELISPSAPMPELPGESLAVRIRLLRNQNRIVQQGREFSMQALEKMNSGVAVVSALGQVVLANSEFTNMTSVIAGECSFADERFRQELSLRLPTPIGRSWLDTWRKVVVGAGSLGFESKLADGRLVYVSCAALAVAEPGTWVVTCTDVTDITSAQNMREEALAFLSHDLRSPIVSVLALVRRGEMDETARQIERYANKSLTISEQFLQLSRLESQPRVETYELDVVSVLENALDQLFTQAADREITLDAGQLAQLPEHGVLLMGNGELLERAFVNLLSNAVKYSDEGGSVEVSVELTDAQVAIAIADQGAGIPAEDLPHLFEPYFRSADPQLARRKGAGLGLRFTKTVIERHGGSLEVTSELGKGSTFVVKMPRHTEPDSSAIRGIAEPADLNDSDVQ